MSSFAAEAEGKSDAAAPDLNKTQSESSVGGIIKALKTKDNRPEGVMEEGDNLDQGVVVGGPEEDAALAAATKILASDGPGAPAIDEFWLRSCLRVHKQDAGKGAARYQAYMRWRGEFGIMDWVDLVKADPAEAKALADHLRVGTLRYTKGYDLDGRPVLNLRLRFHDPKQYAAARMIKLLHLVLEHVLRTEENAHKFGVCFFGDMNDIGVGNLDTRIPKEVFRSFSGHVPVRLGRIILLKPPFFFRMVFPVVKMFLKKKFVDRIKGPYTSTKDLRKCIDDAQILPEYYGTLAYDHNAWMDTVTAGLPQDGKQEAAAAAAAAAPAAAEGPAAEAKA